MNDVFARLQKFRVFPILTVDDAAKAGPLADALREGGLGCAEVTFRTAAGAAVIRAMAARGDLLVGAGTVLNTDLAKQAVDAGASFMVTPGFNPDVVTWCLDHRVPVAPGIATPTDIEQALEFGLTVLKFFPAEAFGGVKTLKALSGPYGHVRFIPTGGITTANLRDYLALPSVLACAGSWIATPELIKAGESGTIARLAREAVAAARA